VVSNIRYALDVYFYRSLSLQLKVAKYRESFLVLHSVIMADNTIRGGDEVFMLVFN